MESFKTLLFCIFLLVISFVNGQNTACNCCSESHRSFDFWLGDWQVADAEGTFLGTNTIDKIQGNCIVRENWVSARAGYTGTSYNFYNSQTDEWEQLWIDNSGQSLHLKGGLENGAMVLLSDPIPQKEGYDLINRVTWTPGTDGTVRQLWETSTDEGAVWKVVFEGIYRRTQE
ncbi:hypothetical protein [Ascidiimonas aurantiaca]|uniref:hypothetical protein n=1 Tax=Ascidiimonas aurantiaca TaxID=1685432 RepID=UPI0030EBD4D9